MSLVFGAIAPHGTLPEAPVPGAEKTHEALAELGRRFDAAAPEATFVLSPHNVHVEGHFAVVLAGTLSGSLAEFDAPEVELSCPVDVELATQAIVAHQDEGVPVVEVPAVVVSPARDRPIEEHVRGQGARPRGRRIAEADRPDRERRPRPCPRLGGGHTASTRRRRRTTNRSSVSYARTA